MPAVINTNLIGQIFPTKRDGDVCIINIADKNHYTVMFLENIYVTNVRVDILFSGHIKNYMKPVVYGIGYVGDGPWMTSINRKTTKTYKTWNDILQRCYAPRHENHKFNWSDVTVHSDWLNFQNFAPWYEEQFNKHGKVNFKWEVDKDLLFPGNRQYGPNVCCLIPQAINGLLNDVKRARGNLPLGVTKTRNQYQARVNVFGKCHELGCYHTIAEAQLAYWSAKFKAIRDTAIQYWQYLPEPLAYRLLTFGWDDAIAYYGDDAVIRL